MLPTARPLLWHAATEHLFDSSHDLPGSGQLQHEPNDEKGQR